MSPPSLLPALAAVLLVSLASPAVSQTCASTSYTISSETSYQTFEALKCTTFSSLSISPSIAGNFNWSFPSLLSVRTLTVAPAGVGTNVTARFPSLTTISSSGSVQVAPNSGGHVVLLDLPKVTTITGQVNIAPAATATPRISRVGLVSLGSAAASPLSITGLVTVTAQFNTVIEAVEIWNCRSMQSLSVTPLASGRIDSVRVNDEAAAASPVMVELGSIEIGTIFQSSFGSLGSLVVAHIRGLSSFSAMLSNSIQHVLIHPFRNNVPALVMSGDILLSGSTAGNVSNISFPHLATVGNIRLTAICRLGLFAVNSAARTNLAVSNIIEIAGTPAPDYGTITFDRLVSAALIAIGGSGGSVGQVRINQAGQCVGLVVSGNLNILSTGARYINPVLVYGLVRVGGTLAVGNAGAATHAGAMINNGGDGCAPLVLASSLTISTTSTLGLVTILAQSIAGSVQIACSSGQQLTAAHIGSVLSTGSVTIQSARCNLGPITFTPPPGDTLSILGSVTVNSMASGSSSPPSFIRNVTMLGLRRIQTGVTILAGGGATIKHLLFAGAPGSDYDVGGAVRIQADGMAEAISLDGVRRIGGAVTILGAATGELLGPVQFLARNTHLEINSTLSITHSSAVRNVLIAPLTRVRGTVTLTSNLDNVTLNAPNGPNLIIEGGLEVGPASVADVRVGPVTVHGLTEIAGRLAVNVYMSSSTIGNGDLQLLGSATEPMTVQGDLAFQVISQSIGRRVVTENLRRVNGSSSIYGFSTVRGPFLINGRSMNRIGSALYQPTTPQNNNPSCINTCGGQGDESSAATSCATISSSQCTCWADAGGAFCRSTCAGSPQTCACACTAWIPWTDVAPGAQIRTRTCPPASGCSTREVRGAVFCASNQFELASPTPTTHRACANITECRGVGLEFEVTSPTTLRNRVCRSITACQPGLEYQTAVPTATSDRVCAPLTVCVPGSTVESSGPTATTDRQCRACVGLECNCKQCQDSEFVSSACIQPPNRDTVCTPCRVCTVDEYVTAACTRLNNTVCAPLTECGSSRFQTLAPTLTSDRVCQEVTACNASEPVFEAQPPTATSNRVCQAIRSCNFSTSFSKQEPTATSDRVCELLSICSPGTQRQSVAPTATTDRVCEFLTNCSAGTFVSTPATGSTDRLCAPCTLGFNYSDADNSAACKPLVPCPPGTREEASNATLPTAPRACVACVPGTFQPSVGRSQCIPVTLCNSTQFVATQATLTSDTVCARLTLCEAGISFQTKAATLSSDRTCSKVAACVAGTSYETRAPSTTSDRECGPVSPPCELAAEYQLQAPTLTSDRQCKTLTFCATGQYEAVPPRTDRDRLCRNYTSCKEGEEEVLAPTASSDRTCASGSSSPSAATSLVIGGAAAGGCTLLLLVGILVFLARIRRQNSKTNPVVDPGAVYINAAYGAVVTGRGNADVALYDFATEQQQLQPDAQVFSPQDGAYLDDSADSDSDVDESLFNRQPQNAPVDPTADAYLQVGEEEEEEEEEESNGEKSDVE